MIILCSQMDRTPLHYAYLFMPQKDIIEQLVKAGGLKERHDPVIIIYQVYNWSLHCDS